MGKKNRDNQRSPWKHEKKKQKTTEVCLKFVKRQNSYIWDGPSGFHLKKFTPHENVKRAMGQVHSERTVNGGRLTNNKSDESLVILECNPQNSQLLLKHLSAINSNVLIIAWEATMDRSILPIFIDGLIPTNPVICMGITANHHNRTILDYYHRNNSNNHNQCEIHEITEETELQEPTPPPPPRKRPDNGDSANEEPPSSHSDDEETQNKLLKRTETARPRFVRAKILKRAPEGNNIKTILEVPTETEQTEGIPCKEIPAVTSLNIKIIAKGGGTKHTVEDEATENAKACMRYSQAALRALADLNNQVSTVLGEFEVEPCQPVVECEQQIVQKIEEEPLPPPILPKIVTIIETGDEPCTQLKQQKKSVFNVPPHKISMHKLGRAVSNLEPTTVLHPLPPLVSVDAELDGKSSRPLPVTTTVNNNNNKKNQAESVLKRYLKQAAHSKPRTAKSTASNMDSTTKTKKTSSASHAGAATVEKIKQSNSGTRRLFGREEMIPEIRQQMKELTKRLGTDGLPRTRARPDLHTQLIKEFEATDSLLEFQRQMHSCGGTGNNESNPPESVAAAEKKQQQQPPPVVEIMAEELFVPERKINKIAKTNLNAGKRKSSSSSSPPPLKLRPKTCQFLYREKKKKTAVTNQIPRATTIQLPRKPKKSSCTTATSSAANNKYVDSLFFSSSKNLRKIESKASKPVPVTDVACDVTQCVLDNFTRSVQTVTTNVSYKTGLDCFDILDEITLKDLKPLESEYPRKDSVNTNEFYTERVENTFLYQLVYASSQEDVLTRLLRIEEPSVVCPEVRCQKCKSAFVQTVENKGCGQGELPIGRPVTNEGGGGRKSCTKDAASNVATPTLSTANSNSNKKRQKNNGGASGKPNKTAKQTNVVVVTTATKTRKGSSANNNKRQSRQRHETVADVAAKLKPYMFDPHIRYPTTITVMPVAITTTYTNPNFTLGTKTKPSQQSGGDFVAASQTNTPSPRKNATGKPPLPANATRYRPPPPSQPTMSSGDKKLYAHKYPKSAGRNLVNYLEKQNVRNPPRSPHGDSWDEDQQVYGTKKVTKIPPKTPRLTVPVKSPPPKRPLTPQSAIQKHATDSRRMLKNIKNLSGRSASLESDIQHVIDLIENKIVDVLSDPNKQTSEAFSGIEREITAILGAMRDGNDAATATKTDTLQKQLEAIIETSGGETTKTTTSDKKQKKTKPPKATANHQPAESGSKEAQLGSGTEPKLIAETPPVKKTSPTASDTTVNHELDYVSSNEERFIVTSSCAPEKQEVPQIQEEADEGEKPQENKDRDDGNAPREEPPTQIVASKEAEQKSVENKQEATETSEERRQTVEKKTNEDQRKQIVDKKTSEDRKKQIVVEKTSEDRRKQTAKQKTNDAQRVEAGLDGSVSKTIEILTVLSPSPSFPTETESYTATKAIKFSPSELYRRKYHPMMIKPRPQPEPKVEEVRSEEFLTPFMHAIKRYRNKGEERSQPDVEISCDILEFLDTLASLSEDGPSLPQPKPPVVRQTYQTIRYRHCTQISNVIHQPEIFCPLGLWFPIVYAVTEKNVQVLFHSDLFDGPKPTEIFEDAPETNARRSRLDKIISNCLFFDCEKNPLTSLLQCRSSTKNVTAEFPGGTNNRQFNHVDCAALLLDTIYGLLFAIVFLCLTFNYSCQ